MPTFVQHEEQAVSNLNFLGEILGMSTESGLKYPDWCVTVCFYAAVHIIEAEIYQQFNAGMVVYFFNGRKIEDTSIRNSIDMNKSLKMKLSPHFCRSLLVNQENGFNESLSNGYRSLYEYSCKARYECYHKNHRNVMKAKKVLDQLVNFHKKNFSSALD